MLREQHGLLRSLHGVNKALLLGLAMGRRAAAGLLLLIGASFVIYLTVRLAPGNAVDAISSMATTEAQRAVMMAEYGLDRGPIMGFFAWLGSAATGDFGVSLSTQAGQEVMALAWPAFERTLVLCGAALSLSVVLALVGAILLGDPRPGQQLLTGPLYVVTVAPAFVVAVVFAQGVNFLTDKYVVQGGYEPPIWHPLMGFVSAADSLMPFVFAGVVLVVSDGIFMDLLNALRAELQALRHAQFISAVRAKGASVLGHIARNMVVPIVSAFASRLPMVVGAVVIVEYVFTIEGAGYVLLEASKARDFPVVVGVSVLFTAVIIAVNIVADILRAVVDPREVARGG